MKRQTQEKTKEPKKEEPKKEEHKKEEPKKDERKENESKQEILSPIQVIEKEVKAKPTPKLPSINTSQHIIQSAFTSRKFNNNDYLHSSLSCPTLHFQLSKTGFLFRKKIANRKIHIKPTNRRGNGIPDTLLDRLKLFSSIFKDQLFIQYYQLTPPRESAHIDTIVRYISNYTGSHGELHKYAMIFYYICNQINFDKKENKEDNAKPENVLKTGTANSDGLSSLFEYFCRNSKLSYRRIEGYCKFFGFKIGDSCLNVNHSWHRIRIKSEWYFCDVTFGSGVSQKKEHQELNYFNPFYFLTPPELLIDSHRPIEDCMQMIAKTVIPKTFSNKSNHLLGDFYLKVYEKNMELLTHDHPVIRIPDKLVCIKIQIKDVALQANLFTASGRTKLGEIKYLFEESESRYSFEVKFPSTGTYIVSIISRASTSTDLIYYPLIDYSIRVGEEYTFKRQLRSIGKNRGHKGRDNTNASTLLQRPHTIQSVCKIINVNGKIPEKPAKKICLDNTNAYLFEPRNSQLKIGNETKFKVKIKGAVAVIVLDGRKWNYLKKKDEDIWEGVALIQTENLSICSLKNSNVFTEVFLFKATKVEQKLK